MSAESTDIVAPASGAQVEPARTAPAARRNMRGMLARASRFWLLIGGLGVALLAAVVVSVAVGAVAVPTAHVVRIIVYHVTGLGRVDWSPTEDLIIWEFRLPRALLAVVVGAALAVSGVILQTLVRNPLADPYMLGVSSGASVGAVAVLTLGPAAAGGLSYSAAAFVGALVAMALVYLLAQQGGAVTPSRLILAGVALAYALQAVTSFLVLRSDRPGGGVDGVLRWLAGTLASATWGDLGVPALALLLTTGFLLLQARPLNALLTGDETATGLGVNVGRMRLALFVVTSLLVGVAVAISGAIGFVGLMIPHIVRAFVGADHRRVLPLAALLGGVYLTLADLLARVVIAPSELPVGLVTAAIGGPFFLWLLRRRTRRASAGPGESATTTGA